MNKQIKCSVRLPTGDRETYKLKPGETTFTDKEGKTYDAPNVDNHELYETDHWFFGKRRFAFYRQGEKKAIPLDGVVPWKTSKVLQEDKDLLIQVTREALRGEEALELKANMQLAGIGLIIILQIAHLIMG